MKKRVILVVLLLLSCTLLAFIIIKTNCKKKRPLITKSFLNTYQADSSRFLPEYKTKPCLYSLLKAIVESNRGIYSADKFFYSLSLKKSDKLKRMTIKLDLWETPENLDYVGVVKCDNSIFLCRGDIENDSLFYKNNSFKIRIDLRSKNDTTEFFPYINEPSLSDILYDCGGLPIYVEVYTKEKIKAY